MKKLIAVGWLIAATASHGEAGQHTGVGGNPAVPPPQPVTLFVPDLVIQTFVIQPGVIIILPDPQPAEAQDPAKDEPSQTDQADK